MRITRPALAAFVLLAVSALGPLSGCNRSTDSEAANARGPVGAIDGVTGGFLRSSDTLGTGRRVDVFGPSNAPVLPTIGAPGFGK